MVRVVRVVRVGAQPGTGGGISNLIDMFPSAGTGNMELGTHPPLLSRGGWNPLPETLEG